MTFYVMIWDFLKIIIINDHFCVIILTSFVIIITS